MLLKYYETQLAEKFIVFPKLKLILIIIPHRKTQRDEKYINISHPDIFTHSHRRFSLLLILGGKKSISVKISIPSNISHIVGFI